VINWSHNDERVRLKVPARVPHDPDLDQAIAMREAVGRPHRILTSPVTSVPISSFGESAIESSAAWASVTYVQRAT
jgi:small-conductance mechanosensitive channel